MAKLIKNTLFHGKNYLSDAIPLTLTKPPEFWLFPHREFPTTPTNPHAFLNTSLPLRYWSPHILLS